ncbi:MAG TPA: hypothetical protein DD435_02565 [Cyanobacteria bacterium UBA8530]|nr:hypothetical protein [Cyanobacteria bacterium UBA8530]
MKRRISGFSRTALALVFFSGFLSLSSLAGCQTPGVPPKNPKNPLIAPTPTPKPTDGTVLDLGFEGSGQEQFVDPVPPAAKASGKFFTANWKLDGGELRQTLPPTQPSLTFLQYVGNAFGTPSGQAPGHYRVEADVRAYQEATVSPDEMVGSPTGMLGIIPYYLDSTHYLLMVATPNELALWNVDGLAPQETWDAEKYQLWHQAISPSLKVGDPLRLGVEVDIKAQRIKVFFNGEMKEVLDAKGILKDQDHYVSLVSNGNFVGYDNFKLKKFE